MTDRIFKTAGNWGLASNGVQWMLMHRHPRKTGDTWDPVSFVRSIREVLARCMREKGVEADTAVLLLEGLPPTFDRWNGSTRL
jgi:hypothetical protein